MDQVKLNKEIEGNKTKRSTYFIRAINCSYSKILVIIKVTKMFLIIIIIIIIVIIIIIITIIKCSERSWTPSTTNTKLFVTLCNV